MGIEILMIVAALVVNHIIGVLKLKAKRKLVNASYAALVDNLDKRNSEVETWNTAFRIHCKSVAALQNLHPRNEYIDLYILQIFVPMIYSLHNVKLDAQELISVIHSTRN